MAQGPPVVPAPQFDNRCFSQPDIRFRKDVMTPRKAGAPSPGVCWLLSFAFMRWTDAGPGGTLPAIFSEGGFQQSGHHSAVPLQGTIQWKQERHQSRQWWVQNPHLIRRIVDIHVVYVLSGKQKRQKFFFVLIWKHFVFPPLCFLLQLLSL